LFIDLSLAKKENSIADKFPNVQQFKMILSLPLNVFITVYNLITELGITYSFCHKIDRRRPDGAGLNS
jgi:hypothetical protein